MGLFPAWHPEWSPAMSWGVGLGASFLFFASVLAHELSHAVVARTQGIPVRRITLFVFGGMAHMEREPPSPKAEFLMAAVGPLTSIAIGVIATLGGWALAEVGGSTLAETPVAAFQALGPVSTLLLWLGPINLLLGIFNMVPGFPLDGGRVLRSILWWSTGDMLKATRWAAGAGQAVAWGLMAWGVFALFSGGLVQGIWLLLIGWFLNHAARASYQQLLVRRALEGVPVVRIMTRHVTTVPPELTIEQFVRERLLMEDQQAFPVVVNSRFAGIVCLTDVRKVPHDRWHVTTVSEIMTPATHVSIVDPHDDAERALEELARRDVDQLPVLEGDHVEGMVRRRDLLKWLALQGHGHPIPA